MLRWIVLAGVLTACGCFARLPVPPDPSPLQARSNRLAAEVSRVRDLQHKGEVPSDTLDQAQVEERMRALVDDEWDEQADFEERAFKRLGLLQPADDYKELYLELVTEEIGGFYDPKRKELFVVERDDEPPPDPNVPLTVLEDPVFVLGHELTHAIEDQHFDLQKLQKEREANNDSTMALSALVEGSAVEAGLDLALSRRGYPLSLTHPSLRGLIQSVAFPIPLDVAMEGYENTPTVLVAAQVFPYTSGWRFVNRLRSEFGWTEVDRTYRDPPESTEQILFPERYLDRRDRPVRIELPAPPFDWKALHEQTLGMLGTQVLLYVRQGEQSRGSADGWDGDRYVLWETPAGDAIGWVSVWDYEDQARDFAETYGEILYMWNGKTGGWAVAREGTVVAAVEDAPPGTAGDVARHLLEHTEITRADDDRRPDRWYHRVLLWPLSLRRHERAWESAALGGWGYRARIHPRGFRLGLLRDFALAERNPDRFGLFLYSLIGFTRDRTIDYAHATVPGAAYWQSQDEGPSARMAAGVLFDCFGYRNRFGRRRLDLVWGAALRIRWGSDVSRGQRLRVLFIPIPWI